GRDDLEVWNAQIQDQDRDRDRDDPVAERLEAGSFVPAADGSGHVVTLDATEPSGSMGPCSRPRSYSTLMVGPLRVSRSVTVPEGDLRWRFSRSSGPGGQSVNTADSRVELSLDLTSTSALGPVQRSRAIERLAGRLVDGVLTITASEHRSQLRNRDAARERLAAILSEAVAPPPPKRRPTRPGPAAVERRLAAKR